MKVFTSEERYEQWRALRAVRGVTGEGYERTVNGEETRMDGCNWLVEMLGNPLRDVKGAKSDPARE